MKSKSPVRSGVRATKRTSVLADPLDRAVDDRGGPQRADCLALPMRPKRPGVRDPGTSSGVPGHDDPGSGTGGNWPSAEVGQPTRSVRDHGSSRNRPGHGRSAAVPTSTRPWSSIPAVRCGSHRVGGATSAGQTCPTGPGGPRSPLPVRSPMNRPPSLVERRDRTMSRDSGTTRKTRAISPAQS